MPLTIDHPRFTEFLDRLTGPEGIALTESGDRCAGPADTTKTVAILYAMGFGEDEIASTLSYYAARGGFSDRDIVLEVGMTAGDQESLSHIPTEDL